MNLPNKLTMFRICMVPVFLVLLCVNLPMSDTAMRLSTAIVFAITSLTDMIDGKIARKYNLITDFGKFMDPLADKFLVMSAMLGILVRFDYLRPVFVWAAAIVIFREFAVTSLRLVVAGKSGIVVAAAWLGKVKTTTQMICIVAILLEPVILPFPLFTEMHLLSYITIAAMTIMTVWSGVDYMKAYWPHISASK
ncbi:MAG: CDP-diacylglycerol--glycerol-3-phosphate 3-phosphatidyltransferase [Clostridia bacterium]|nr:CDP-diacylglycerol--glycerol-3-phosphate 3-phosphatidyltransferase [Oscillospiraceae bacterium]MBO4933490.1 CDP-diacylglycerol--glycerol-3-phosphate 3-phosphatidyltransferase [Clostridia bacterium]MBO5126509.1 CDP-diacylglycerol--glycerol-3-phosphate 3-phosphatidyltransferase [Clostridia bacterium]MBO5256645.1 CDP-diacylglycerol--glycerol-3-phosphate 3-phosphatidyltransferase [Clostridia bacterium]MBP3293439.1 CDP-diacylglycerol--glycerol-3-phosphate 3-phosphatidyltransferase [Clostridia bac